MTRCWLGGPNIFPPYGREDRAAGGLARVSRSFAESGVNEGRSSLHGKPPSNEFVMRTRSLRAITFCIAWQSDNWVEEVNAAEKNRPVLPERGSLSISQRITESTRK
jgi:hypothetical protein